MKDLRWGGYLHGLKVSPYQFFYELERERYVFIVERSGSHTFIHVIKFSLTCNGSNWCVSRSDVMRHAQHHLCGISAKMLNFFLWSMNQTHLKCVHSLRHQSCKCHFHKRNNSGGTILKWRRLNAPQMQHRYLDRVLEIDISLSLCLSLFQDMYFGCN